MGKKRERSLVRPKRLTNSVSSRIRALLNISDGRFKCVIYTAVFCTGELKAVWEGMNNKDAAFRIEYAVRLVPFKY